MNPVNKLYQDLLLAHHKHPRFATTIDPAWATVEKLNPSCGDRICLGGVNQHGTLTELACDIQACAIARASASIMSEWVIQKGTDEIAGLTTLVEQLLHGEADAAELSEDLQALASVSAFPLRISCALLPWQALQHLL